MKKLILVFLLLFTNFCFSQQIIEIEPLLGEQINGSHPLAVGLVMRLLINEGSGNVYDVSLNSNDGILTNMTDADWVVEDGGYALNFDGNKSVNIPDHPSLNLTNGVTICVWVKPDGTGDYGLLSKSDLSDFGAYGLTLFGGNAFFRATIAEATGNWDITGEGSFPAGEIVHIVVTYDLTDAFLYKNGLEVASNLGISAAMTTNADPINIGDYVDGNFDGTVLDISLYNRALSAKESLSLYISQFAMFEQSLYGRILAAAAAATPATKKGVRPRWWNDE